MNFCTKQVFFICMIGGLTLMSSCAQMMTTAVAKPTFAPNVVYTATFTTIEHVIKLKIGMDFNTVVGLLEIPPYNLQTKDSQVSIYVWNYRKIQRIGNSQLQTSKEGMKDGESYVVNTNLLLYCVFDKDDKLKGIITEEGNEILSDEAEIKKYFKGKESETTVVSPQPAATPTLKGLMYRQ